jgi:hypothetical protein
VEENDKKKLFIKSLSQQENYQLILTEDCFLLLQKLANGNGKIAFWSALFAITDLQINKCNKITTINFYDEESSNEYQIKLKIDNILLFRDLIVKRMRKLKVKVESHKVIKGHPLVRRLSEKEIKFMKINDIEKHIKELQEKINNGEINDYTVNTFSTLCGKAVEHFSKVGDKKYEQYMNMMKSVFKLEKVDKLTIDNEKESKESDKDI